jgi:hypothetical protein
VTPEARQTDDLAWAIANAGRSLGMEVGIELALSLIYLRAVEAGDHWEQLQAAARVVCVDSPVRLMSG